MSVMQEILQELRQSEKLLEEEKKYIHFLLEQIQDDTSLKDMIGILQDNKTLIQQIKTTRFIRFFFFLIGFISFVISVFFVCTNNFDNFALNYNSIFKTIFFLSMTFYFFYQMKGYNQQFQKLSSEKRSIEKIADILRMMEKSRITVNQQEKIIVQVFQELLKVQIKNISL